MLTDDVFMSMPPLPLEYEGRDVVACFYALLFGTSRAYHLIPTRANGQLVFGFYVPALTVSVMVPASSCSHPLEIGSAP